MKTGPKPKDKKNTTPLKGIPDPPVHLDKVARSHWKKVARLIDDSGLLSEIDVFALEQYCDLYSTWRKAKEKVEVEGEVIIARNGYSQQNPWYVTKVQVMKDMKSFITMFGLSPAARSKLTPTEAEEIDPKWSALG